MITEVYDRSFCHYCFASKLFLLYSHRHHEPSDPSRSRSRDRNVSPILLSGSSTDEGHAMPNIPFTGFTIRIEIKAVGSIQTITKIIGMELIAKAALEQVGAAALDEDDETHNLINATFNGNGTITKADGSCIRASSVVLRFATHPDGGLLD